MTDQKVPTYIQTPQGLVNAADLKTVPDRAFRDAWVLQGEVIDIDLVKAKEIAKEKIRASREAAFKKADTEFMLALERGESTAEVVAKKAKLRDATEDKRLNAKSPEKLKAALDAIVAEIEAI